MVKRLRRQWNAAVQMGGDHTHCNRCVLDSVKLMPTALLLPNTTNLKIAILLSVPMAAITNVFLSLSPRCVPSQPPPTCDLNASTSGPCCRSKGNAASTASLPITAAADAGSGEALSPVACAAGCCISSCCTVRARR